MPRPKRGEEGRAKWIKLRLEGEKKEIFMTAFKASGFSTMTDFIWHLVKKEYDNLPKEKRTKTNDT